MIDPVRSTTDEAPAAKLPPEQPSPASAGPGALLSDERRRQGLSLGDIARQLKLSVRQIEALERDDYAVFSGMVFVRGFLRNYAKLLALDPEALIAQLPGTPAATAPAPEGAPGETISAAGSPAGKRGYGWLTGAAVLAVLVLGAIYEGRQHHSSAPATAPAQALPGGPVSPQHADSPPAGLPTAAPDALPAAPGDVAQSATGSIAITAGPVPGTPPAPGVGPAAVSAEPARPAPSSPGVTAAPIPGTPATVAAAMPSPSAAAAQVRPSIPATATSVAVNSEAGQLRLRFDAEAWVEVKDASGALVFSQLGTAGSEQVVQGRPPLQLVVGNAHAVTVTYQGRVVDLGPHTRVDVARLVLE